MTIANEANDESAISILDSEMNHKGAWRKETPPGNYSQEDLIAIYARVNALQKAAKSVLGTLKEAFLAHTEFVEDTYTGYVNDDTNVVGLRVIKRPGRATLDKQSIEDEMGEQFIQKHTKVGEDYYEVREVRQSS